MKHVFTNSMVAHVWAQRSQPSGRSGSMRFDGTVGYSYQTPVAHIVEAMGTGPNLNRTVLLMVPNSWGNTTGKHLSLYHRAYSGDVFVVPEIFAHRFHIDGSEFHGDNTKYLLAQYAKERARLMKCQCDSYSLRSLEGHSEYPTQAHATLSGLAERFANYCRLFNVCERDAQGMPDWRADAEAAIARRDRLLANPKRQATMAQREADRLRRNQLAQARRFAAQEDMRKAWSEGRIVSVHFTDEKGGAYLRIVGGSVVTSQGAQIPIEDARRIIPKLLTLRALNKPIHLGGTEDRTVGHFTVDMILTDGIRAGCHFIQWNQIEAIGKALGVL